MQTDIDFPCGICDNRRGNTFWKAREMMFGLRRPFRYMECGACGCVQLADPPVDWSPYYPPSYYSFASATKGRNSLKMKMRQRMVATRNSFAFTGHGLQGRLLDRFVPAPSGFAEMRCAGLTPESRILDVGAGSGQFLDRLRQIGFRHLAGIDPYLKADIHLPGGVTIRKQSIHQCEESEWDLIMFHHAFEHIADQLTTLQRCVNLVSADGWCWLRLPVASSYAWTHYRSNWVQLDPPRHLFLHTDRSIALLAKRAGLVIMNWTDDSTPLQFWGSEQYARDIPLLDEKSYGTNPKESIFTQQEIQRFREEADSLNQQRRGDQASIWLKRI